MGAEDELGLHEPISRRDFIGGVATAGVAAAGAFGPVEAAARAATATGQPPLHSGAPDAGVPTAPYPPIRSGLRGQHPGSFEVAHEARDGRFAGSLEAIDTGEHYDLVVVGAGISGLASALLYQRALGAQRRILVLDNHDDFGGHAKRNEFHYGGRVHLSFGGSMSIETPFPYSFTAKSLLKELGVEAETYERYQRPARIASLSRGIFFDREHFLADKVVAGAGTRPWADFFAEAPLSDAVRVDLLRLHTGQVDYLPDFNPQEKSARLKAISYQSFLVDHARLAPESLPYFLGLGWDFRNNKRVDTCPAYEAWKAGAPGFQGMQIAGEPKAESAYFHFPDGNATIARLIVSRLNPAVFSGGPSPEAMVTARADYAALDRPGDAVRIRLNSMVVRVEHTGPIDIASERAVRVVYSVGGQLRQVTAANAILACFNMVIPYIVPELPEEQVQALHYASKVPMQITNVLLRDWLPLQRLKVSEVHAPNGYHTELMLDEPTAIGEYQSLGSASQPAMIQLVRNPNRPGLPRREQNRLGRAEMLAASFEEIEMATRLQLQRMLGPAGFEAKRDILGLTVNRWPHGYAYTYDTLGDAALPEGERPHVVGRRRLGRIAIANADSGAGAFVNVAIDQAERAVQECLESRGLR